MTGPTCIETHMSKVWLFPTEVWKVLKPVHFPFADLRSLERRIQACQDEMEHNAPWAPGVYIDVVRVSGEPPSLDPEGQPAIRMARLDRSHALTARLETLEVPQVKRVGAAIRAIHRDRPAREESSRPSAVRARIAENLDELAPLVSGDDLRTFQRIRARYAVLSTACEAALEARAALGRVLHGDLRCEHVFLGDAVHILDGVAFSPALAEGDPAEDVAFLAMDLAIKGRWDLEDALWATAMTRPVPRELRRLYTGHRSLIRAKVALLQGSESRARRHLIHALVRWEEPAEKPVLVGIGGLPGVGKSTLGHLLEKYAGFEVLRSDVVRKAEAALGPPDYTEEGRTAVYTEVLKLAGAEVASGRRVVVDASFCREAWRDILFDKAEELGVPAVLLVAHADPTTARARLAAREGDASDADGSVYDTLRESWEAVSPRAARHAIAVDTGTTMNAALESAADALVSLGVAALSLNPR